MGEGPRGRNGARSTLWRTSVTSSATHNQIGPLWCWFPSGWACARSRRLWVSPMNSPVRLGVSPAVASTPMGVFNQRFEALFTGTGALGCALCFAPLPVLSVYLCTNVGPQGLPATTLWGPLAAAWPAPLHNLPPRWVCQPPPCRESSLPAACLRPSYRSGWMFLLYLLGCRTSIHFNFVSVLVLFLNFRCPSFGCGRRHSVSPYTSILAGSSTNTILTFSNLYYVFNFKLENLTSEA